jgi:hypothetical protein
LLTKPGGELLDDPAGDHVCHIEDVADVRLERAGAGCVVALELVDCLWIT